MELQSMHSSRMSQELYDKLMRAFPPIEIRPDTTIDAIRYSAGQQKVLAWIQYELTGKVYRPRGEFGHKISLWTRFKRTIRRMYDSLCN